MNQQEAQPQEQPKPKLTAEQIKELKKREALKEKQAHEGTTIRKDV